VTFGIQTRPFGNAARQKPPPDFVLAAWRNIGRNRDALLAFY
jgi:hypothetical protein